MQLPEKKYIASFDIDAQNTFTPVCPDELPVAEGDTIAPELNAQAQFASLRLASRDAHSRCALWISDAEHAPLTPISGYPDLDIRWPAHAIIGTKGFDFIEGLDEAAYDYQVFKGIEADKHPYGACYHDLKDTLSTGAIEYLRCHGITTVICGGLATDYCVKNTAAEGCWLRRNPEQGCLPRHCSRNHRKRYAGNGCCRSKIRRMRQGIS